MVYTLLEIYAYDHEDSGNRYINGYLTARPEISERSNTDFWKYCNEIYGNIDKFGRLNYVVYETEEEALNAYEKRIKKYFKEMETCFENERNSILYNFFREIENIINEEGAFSPINGSCDTDEIKEIYDETKKQIDNPYPLEFERIPVERYFPAIIAVCDENENGKTIKSLQYEEKPDELRWKTILEMQLCSE